MVVRIDEHIQFEVEFDILEREEGFEDDIRFAIHETGLSSMRVFAADTTSILITPDQAERLAQALLAAAEASGSTE